MTTSNQLLSWTVLREKYISKGVPFEQSVMVEQNLRLVFDSSPSRLGIRVRADVNRTPPDIAPLRNIVVRKVLLHGESCIEVLTEEPDLFRSIYALISDVLLRMRDGELDCLMALELSLADFDALLERSALFTREKALGLYGELWVLELILHAGISTVDCWIGPQRQSHDFRLDDLELEVKATASNVRQHTVNDLNQLSASLGHRLMLVSLTLGLSGSGVGRSLDELASNIRSIVAKDGASSKRLEQMLKMSGYEQGDPECRIPYLISAPPVAVEIGVDFPNMSYEWLSDAIGSDAAARLGNFQFTLNLEGLGSPFVASQLVTKTNE
ncbi:PD-(D/E)XK motif protein [Dyella kyungheensis]|uniref:PD-(D/E)XK motif protein n=1 Tax=Dyella kyungheensis TaxID=1242174 RepID=UPI003CE94F65